MSQSWLKDLEAKVHAASEALRGLREENDALKARVKELENAASADAADASGSDGAASWQKERDEIRNRVEKLAGNLAELLGEG